MKDYNKVIGTATSSQQPLQPCAIKSGYTKTKKPSATGGTSAQTYGNVQKKL